MNTNTLFAAYAKCRNEMACATQTRSRRLLDGNGSFGIGRADDEHALRYQRYARLAWKIEHRFGYAMAGQKTCPICGYPRAHCDGKEQHKRHNIGLYQRMMRESARRFDELMGDV